MRSKFDLRPVRRLARLIRRERFALLHTHTPRTAMVGRLASLWAGVPMVHHVHGHTASEVGAGSKAGSTHSAKIATPAHKRVLAKN